jgi:uncharacterized membrane protein
LYVVITLLISPFGYGAIQFRLSEIFNHLIDFNKIYIWSLILGCAVANMFSPLGIIDMVFGLMGTVLASFGIYFINKHVKNVKAKLVVSTIVPTITMFPVAIELMIVNHLPFWATYATCAVGEFVSCAVGAFIVYAISKRIDLTK